jgi:adenylate kinase family enzyme
MSHLLPPIFFIIGPPGSSKGTLCSYLAPMFNLAHIVAGDLLRDEVKNNTTIGREVIGPLLADGKIIPSEITIQLINNKVLEVANKNKNKNNKNDEQKEQEGDDNEDETGKESKNNINIQQGILLDGFPRKIDQSNMFEDGMAKARAVVYFDCQEEVMLQRLLGRGRDDDKVDVIRKRFQSNQEQCEPVKDMFAKQGRLHVLDTNRSIEEVCAAAKKLFSETLGLKIVDDKVEIPKV